MTLVDYTLEEFMHILYKGCAIALLIALSLTVFVLKSDLSKAEKYIERLESDFPEYIDVTSGTDEFTNYYN